MSKLVNRTGLRIGLCGIQRETRCLFPIPFEPNLHDRHNGHIALFDTRPLALRPLTLLSRKTDPHVQPILRLGRATDARDGLMVSCRWAEASMPWALRSPSEDLETSGARVLYCMPTLQSPTARTMSLARRHSIAEVVEELDLTVIEDDVYGFFFAERPVPIASLAPSRTFYVTSYSKCLAPAFRLGTLTVPKAYIAQVELLLHASAWFVTPMLSETVLRLIESGKLEELRRERRVQALERYRVFLDVFPKAERLQFPAFYGWLPLPQEWSADQFAAAARARGILVTPRIASAVGETEPGAVRICLGAPKDTKELSNALQTLGDILRRYPVNVVSVA